MKKIFTKLIGVTLGLAMAVGVGVGVAANNRAATELDATDVTNETITISSIAEANGLVNDVATKTIVLNSYISLSTAGTNNNGKYYTSNSSWRLYEANNGRLTVQGASGVVLSKITFTYSASNSGTLYKGSTNYASGTEIDISGNSYQFDGVKHTSGSKNGSIQITSVKLSYSYEDGPQGDPTALNLTGPTSNMEVGDTYQIEYSFEGGSAAITSWESDDENVVTVSNGLVTAVGGGTATITASTGALDGTCDITVNDPTPVNVDEALAIIEPLSNNQKTLVTYITTGYITNVTTPWNGTYHNITFNLGVAYNSANTVAAYRATAADGTDGSALKTGDRVSVVGKLTKYSGNAQIADGVTTLIEASTSQDVTNLDAEATTKTVEQVKAYNSADNTLIAKVSGVAEHTYGNAQYGNFYLTNPASGEAIVVYGGYTDTTFEKTLDVYNSKQGTMNTPVTSSAVGHSVTVYGTIGVHDGVGQLVNARVVIGDAYAGNVSASVSVNDNEMGSATISATSISYGSELIVTPNPELCYQVSSVKVTRAYGIEEELTVESDGTYRFNAESKNNVSVVFESDGSIRDTFQVVSSIAVGDVVYLACETASNQFNGISDTSTKYGLGEDYTTSPDQDGLALTVVAGSEEGTFAFKIGDANSYLSWSSGNSLASANSVTNNSSWTVAFDNGDVTIKNYAQNTRVIWWNSGSPRFACYENKAGVTGYEPVQLWKSVKQYFDTATAVATLQDDIIRLGSSIPEEAWNSINEDWEIVDYGVMIYKTDSESNIKSSTPVEDAYRAGVVQPAIARKGNGVAPQAVAGVCTFTARMRVSNVDTIFCSASFVVAGGHYYFFNEQHVTARQLAA